MKEKIILSNCISELDGKNFNVRETITRLNKAILDFCVAILDYQNDMTKIANTLDRCCVLFATCTHYTYIDDKEFCAELMQNIRKGSFDVLETFKNKNPIDAARTIAYEIGIVSESETNYTVADRMILVITAARKLGFKFDFNWKL